MSTKAQLAGLAAIVNGTAKDAAGDAIAQDTFSGKTVTLAKDIALDSSNDKYTKKSGTFGQSSYPMKADYYTVNDDADIWTPIGSGVATGNSDFTSRNYFSGTFDGNGHAVSGIYTDGSETGSTVQGLFGCLGDGGLIENVTTEGCITAKMVAGGVAAYVNGGTIENCTNKAIVYANGGEKAGTGLENGTSRAGAVGGIAGNAASGTNNAVISDCTNEGNVTCTNTRKGGRAGGILGLVDGSGAGYTGSVTKCMNAGKVDAYQYSGGIIGMDASTTFPITNSFNKGDIKVHSPGSAYVGGIAATGNSGAENCFNRGDVTIEFNGPTGKAAHAAGIIEASSGTLKNCYNIGKVSFGGTATSESSMEPICVSGTADNCYYLDSTGTTTTVHGVSKTADQMKLPDFVDTINSSGSAYAPDLNLDNDGYPVLSYRAADPSKESLAMAKVLFEGKTDAEIAAKARQLDIENMKKEAEKVAAYIGDIGTVTKDSSKIVKARNAYDDAVANATYGDYLSNVFEAAGYTKALKDAESDYAALDISKAKAVIAPAVYNGKAQKPEVKLQDANGNEIAADQYKVICDGDNTNAGTCDITIKALSTGKYFDTLDTSFTIGAAEIKDDAIQAIASQTYTGKALKPALTVRTASGLVLSGTDYSAVYSSNKLTGKASVKVTANGNFKGTATATFKIKPAKARITSLKAGKGKFTVKIKSQAKSGVNGYQVTYKKKGTSKWKSVNTKDLGKTVKNLKRWRYFYVKVRAYKSIDGKAVYGKYSSMHKVFTK